MQIFYELMNYIEGHINEEISVEHVAKIVGVSPYHQKRTVSFITGITLPE